LVWQEEAIALVRDWEFKPGIKNGVPVPVPCTLDLIWGPRELTAKMLERRSSGTEMSPPTAGGSITLDGSNGFGPTLLDAPPPEYTDEARRAELEGAVAVSLVVGENGKARDLHVVRPLGLGLDEKAIEAVSRWRFAPAVLNGHGMAVPATVEVTFRLH
jgi:TonB family protein